MDTMISLDLVRLAAEEDSPLMLLMTGDSDFFPAVEAARESAPACPVARPPSRRAASVSTSTYMRNRRPGEYRPEAMLGSYRRRNPRRLG